MAIDFNLLALLVTGAVLLVVALALARAGSGLGVPFLIGLVVVGIVEAALFPKPPQVQLDPPVLGLFLPALIFEAAWNIDEAGLRRAAYSIFALAVPGTLLTAAIIAAAAFAAGVPAPSALVLGAILGATDPVAVLALFRRLGLPGGLRTLVEGESIANDGVAAQLSLGLVGVAMGAPLVHGPAGLALEMLAASFAGILIGIFVAFPAAAILSRTRNVTVGVAVTLAAAYGAYALASPFYGSGIFASAAAGVAARAFFVRAPIQDEKRNLEIERFWEIIAFVANAAVFYLIGLSLRLEAIFGEPRLIAFVLLGTVVARLLLAYVVLPGRGLGPGWRNGVALSGLRGGLSLALALGLPVAMPGRQQVLDATFAIVFVTLVVQGTLLAPVLQRLELRD